MVTEFLFLVYSLLFKPSLIKFSQLIMCFSLAFLTNTLVEKILSTGVKVKSATLCPGPLKCCATGKFEFS